MCEQRGRVESARLDGLDEPAHPLLAARAERGHDRVITKVRREGVERDAKVGGIDAKARQCAARSETTQAGLERRLGAERLDGDIDATPLSEAKYLVDRVDPAEIDDMVSAETPRHFEPFRQSSIAMIVDAPRSFAPTVAHRPMGPCAKIATMSSNCH